MANLVPEFAPEAALAACKKLQLAGDTLPADASVPYGGDRVAVVPFVSARGDTCRCVAVSPCRTSFAHTRTHAPTRDQAL